MVESNTRSEEASKYDFSYMDELHLGGIEQQIARGDYVSGAELADALRKHGSRPVPADVLEYLCRLLDGDVPKPRGRRAIPPLEVNRFNMIIAGVYQILLAKLQDHKRQYGDTPGWTKLQKTPGEIAARIVARRYLSGAESWKTVHNIASSRRKRRIVVNAPSTA